MSLGVYVFRFERHRFYYLCRTLPKLCDAMVVCDKVMAQI